MNVNIVVNAAKEAAAKTGTPDQSAKDAASSAREAKDGAQKAEKSATSADVSAKASAESAIKADRSATKADVSAKASEKNAEATQKDVASTKSDVRKIQQLLKTAAENPSSAAKVDQVTITYNEKDDLDKIIDQLKMDGWKINEINATTITATRRSDLPDDTCPCCGKRIGGDYICRPATCQPIGPWGPVCPPPVLLIVKILYAVHDFTTDFVARC